MFFNPEEVKRDIENFRTTMDDYIFQLKSAGLDFFTSLYDNWCSGRASDFSKRYSYTLYNATVYEVQFSSDIIHSKMISAFDQFARANNYPTIGNGTYTFSGKENDDFGMLRDMSSTGVIGMNKNAVKKALDEYVSTLKKICSNIENYNFKLAFYDDKGDLEAAKMILRQNVQKIASKIDPIINDITVYTQYETDRSDLALQQAIDQLRG